jgi:hypothetical protein
MLIPCSQRFRVAVYVVSKSEFLPGHGEKNTKGRRPQQWKWLAEVGRRDVRVVFSTFEEERPMREHFDATCFAPAASNAGIRPMTVHD